MTLIFHGRTSLCNQTFFPSRKFRLWGGTSLGLLRFFLNRLLTSRHFKFRVGPKTPCSIFSGRGRLLYTDLDPAALKQISLDVDLCSVSQLKVVSDDIGPFHF